MFPTVPRVGKLPSDHYVSDVDFDAEKFRPVAVVDHFVSVDCETAQLARPRINLNRLRLERDGSCNIHSPSSATNPSSQAFRTALSIAF
jgi:hypothetical protein